MINHTTAPTLNQHLYPHKDKSDNKVAEHSGKTQSGSLSPETSQKVLNEKLVDSIDKVLQKNRAAPIRTLNPQDYTPKAVSDRILNYVQDAIDRAETRGDSRSALLAEARQGVKRGFQDAENILSSLNALSGKIAENVQRTFDLIQGGLDKLGQSNPAQVQHSTSLESIEHSSSRSLSLDITTNDGDIVSLSLEKNQSTGNYSAQIQNGQTSAAVSEFSFESSSSFSFAVQGVLDKGESKAIEELLSSVKGVADQFFKGNAGAAFEAGLNLGFNTSELTSFSLNLDQNQTQSVTQAYREVSSFGDSRDSSRPPIDLENLLKPIHDFAKSLESTLFNAANSNKFENNAVENMFSFFAKAEETHRAMIEQLESLSGKPIESITHDIISQIKN